MRGLTFKSIVIASSREKRGLMLNLNSRRVLLLGDNQTGKSFVLKCLFLAFGCQLDLPSKWHECEPRILVKFEVQGADYHILREGDTFTVFSSDARPIIHTSSIYQLSEVLSTIVRFRLRLATRDLESVTPPPAYYFALFYIDQENGWRKQFGSFRLGRPFVRWELDLLRYFCGLRGNEYYDTQEAYQAKLTRYNEVYTSVKSITEIKNSIEDSSQVYEFALDKEVFSSQISELTVQANALKLEEDKFRSKTLALEESRRELVIQLELARRAAKELSQDLKFSEAPDMCSTIDCPTCGASYSNSFAERFFLGGTYDGVVEMLKSIKIELEATESHLKKVRRDFAIKSEASRRVEALLAGKTNEISFQEIIQVEGHREVLRLIQENRLKSMEHLGQLSLEVHRLRETLKSLENEDRTQTLNEAYEATIIRALDLLDALGFAGTDFRNIHWKIKGDGNEKARGILAYFYSVVQLASRYSKCELPPIVIDTPKQQDPSDENYRRMLDLIINHFPPEHQLILAARDIGQFPFEGESHFFTEKYHALREDHYSESLGIIDQFSNRTIFLDL